ncbi:DUF692 family multinuclear iron-containing protein [Nocardia sp. NPDC004068]|uniref:multinuclear nonheme iron-dependent oxidase n=1 Tax=Nocardia sp. NPDC004068 TaxID=3364303 RepID=UPI00367B898D
MGTGCSCEATSFRGGERGRGPASARSRRAALDLHNIWANARNGRQPVDEFLAEIPFDRVWEIHVAGGFG